MLCFYFIMKCRYGGKVLRKYSKLLAITLCTAMMVTSVTGCGKKDSDNKVTSEAQQNADCLSYVTLGNYSSIELKKSEIDDEVNSQISDNIKNT